ISDRKNQYSSIRHARVTGWSVGASCLVLRIRDTRPCCIGASSTRYTLLNVEIRWKERTVGHWATRLIAVETHVKTIADWACAGARLHRHRIADTGESAVAFAAVLLQSIPDAVAPCSRASENSEVPGCRTATAGRTNCVGAFSAKFPCGIARRTAVTVSMDRRLCRRCARDRR